MIYISVFDIRKKVQDHGPLIPSLTNLAFFENFPYAPAALSPLKEEFACQQNA